MRCTRLVPVLALALLVAPACAEKQLDASDPLGEGHACDPSEPEGEPKCEAWLVCDPTSDDGYVCAAPLELRGRVFDALSGAPIADAVIAALDETGAPIGDATRSDADGSYVLRVTALRDPEGELAPMLRWTLFAVALDHAPFPGGVRTAIPIDASTADSVPDDDDHDIRVIDNPTTAIALVPLGDALRGGVTVRGTVGGEHPGGTLVVAEGGTIPAPYTIADASGAYVLFNVHDASTLRGYRHGLELAPASIGGGADRSVDLAVVREDIDALASVVGSVNIVDAGGGASTSVVLVPSSVYDEALARGPVPAGLRAPSPPQAPSVSGAFTITGVPSGDYHVLAAFENDGLVRDPDESIAGTTIQQVEVPSSGTASVPESFKITGALDVLGPGAESPELVSAAPMLRWSDDSSEQGYEVVVFDARGAIVWSRLDVPRVTGNAEVAVAYEGPLEPGMYYQFRATSVRGDGDDRTAISRTEDLRGVFVVAAP